MRRADWRGVFPAITTKFLADGGVDLAAVAADVAFQIEAGVDGIICCGSLGEASTLEADEKIAIATAAKAAAGKVPVFLTIAEDSTRAAERMAERATKAGMDGLMVLPAMDLQGSVTMFGKDVVFERTGRLGYALRVSPNHFDDPLTRPCMSLLKWSQ